MRHTPVWIKKHRKPKGEIGYDFIGEQNLTPEALALVEDLFDDMAEEEGIKPKVVRPTPNFGVSPRVDYSLCEIYYKILKRIILNERNWVKSQLKWGKCCATCEHGIDESYDWLVVCKKQIEGSAHSPGVLCEEWELRKDMGKIF